jgi:hypothetical protein
MQFKIKTNLTDIPGVKIGSNNKDLQPLSTIEKKNKIDKVMSAYDNQQFKKRKNQTMKLKDMKINTIDTHQRTMRDTDDMRETSKLQGAMSIFKTKPEKRNQSQFKTVPREYFTNQKDVKDLQ